MPTPPTQPPRLHGLLATTAPIALIFRRGPSDWFHLLRWRLDSGTIEPGAWVRKKLFPRRCDLSDDGELLLYYLSGGIEGHYRVFAGVSRAPWLHPLASWDEHDTWGRGWFFTAGQTNYAWGEPKEQDLVGLRVAVQKNDTISFVNERRRGWVEAPDCPPRATDDTWDEKRSVILQKSSSANGCTLRMLGGLYQPEGGMDGNAPQYELDLPSGQRTALHEAAWAEWDHWGHLLLATKAGHLIAQEVRDGSRVNLQRHDLSQFKPDPLPPPAWATSATLDRTR